MSNAPTSSPGPRAVLHRAAALRSRYAAPLLTPRGVANPVLVVLAAMLAVVVVQMLGVAHWSHDSARYISIVDMAYKVIGEGRWILLFAFPVTHIIPPGLALVLNYALVLAGLYLVALPAAQDRRLAAIFALAVALFPGLVAQMMWPATSLPASAAFALSALLVRRFGWIVCPVVAVLCFATMPYFYYILLLMLAPVRPVTDMLGFVRYLLIGLYWCASFVFAFLVSGAFNILLSGKFGIQIADWRVMHPVETTADLVSNFVLYMQMFLTSFREWLIFPLWLLAALFVAGFAIFDGARDRRAAALVLAAGFALVCALSPFVTTFAAGVAVGFRSLLPIAAAAAFLIIALPHSGRVRVKAVAAALLIGAPSFVASLTGAAWLAGVTSVNAANVERNAPRRLSAYREVVLDDRAREAYFSGVRAQTPFALDRPHFVEPIGDGSQMAGAFYEHGARSLRVCGSTTGDEALCAEAFALFDAPGACEDVLAQMCFRTAPAGDVIFVRLLP